MNEANLGSFRPADPSVLDDDPFWSVVRRRHPDVDVVLLADPPDPDPHPDPDGPSDRAGSATDLATLRTVADELLTAWHAVAPLLPPGTGPAPGAPDAPGVPAVRWSARDGAHALLLVKAVRDTDLATGTDLLRRIAFDLGGRGWRLAPSGDEEQAVLDAAGGLVDLHAVAGRAATTLMLATGLLQATEADRDTVLAEVRTVLAGGAAPASGEPADGEREDGEREDGEPGEGRSWP
ncbi:hypothetical protein JK386_06525 [Nocardioides sp. zg-536]|uniref:Uncharacterized protein n=1 Tax=Nocardioides faecalis TaxID=2803858 RepID=A0A939BV52_9ACTN|nr:hypothetical protein [Nocardioides faecalis]MBM9459551.1 hypothetical protein [Nocardioides faecalis]QVI58083.1 hypothetical protein KG111_13820 [Nocardioides faecalis]